MRESVLLARCWQIPRVWLSAWFLLIVTVYAENPMSQPPATIQVDVDNLQATLDAAPEHSTVAFNRNRQLTLSEPLIVRKPLTIQGLNAKLPEKLGGTPLVIVESKDVSVIDCEFRGNRETVPQELRAPLLTIREGNFRVERCNFLDSSKDGIKIDGEGVKDRDIEGGVIRDIYGKGCVRDLVSLSGGGEHGHRIRHVLVENIRDYDSEMRGAVEVSDGTCDITVRNVYAERCVYALDVQDHGKPQQVNTNVLIEDVTAVDCKHIIRTANHDFGHANLTLRDFIGERCSEPLKVSNTRNVVIDNVQIGGHPKGGSPVSVKNCSRLSVREVTIENSAHEEAGLLLVDCSGVFVDNLAVTGEGTKLAHALLARYGGGKAYSGLQIHNVSARNVSKEGVRLERSDDASTLSDVVISDNMATVENLMTGTRVNVQKD
ncbi:MAG: right-handed parallel beta-helix repeat-containing protein [Candidatus Hydrogenedentes bacterium]|nr:right-handed parallel beta-helix repeat-containing protein [Candidatus Hydrogenedentota bacterium]